MKLLTEEVFDKIFGFINDINIKSLRFLIKLIIIGLFIAFVIFMLKLILNKIFLPLIIIFGAFLFVEIIHFLRKMIEKLLESQLKHQKRKEKSLNEWLLR
jgi:hypothetical protein